MQDRVILVGIGGGSSSGKTTLAAQLSAVIPDCVVLHQDDFWASLEDIPIHSVKNVPDVEDPAVTIEWPAFREAFKRFRSSQPFEDSHPKSIEITPTLDKFNSSLRESFTKEWRDKFNRVKEERMRQGVRIQWRLVEGYVLYYDKEITNDLDLSIFLRISEHIRKQRWQGRQYFNKDGTIWTNLPEHWDLMSYPAYIRAHAHLFQGGDVEKGSPLESYKLLLIEGEGTEQNMSFEELLEAASNAILRIS